MNEIYKLHHIQNPVAEMGKEMTTTISIALLLVQFIFSVNLVSSSSSIIQFQGELQGAAGSGGDCSGEKVGECSPETEMEMDSDSDSEMKKNSSSSRRVLWGGGAAAASQKRYISYDALRRDNVPCNRPGIPYYNCHALPKANPYTRGCSVITGCARGGD